MYKRQGLRLGVWDLREFAATVVVVWSHPRRARTIVWIIYGVPRICVTVRREIMVIREVCAAMR